MKNLLAYTKIVVGVTTLPVGMAIYLLDLMIQGTLGTIKFLAAYD